MLTDDCKNRLYNWKFSSAAARLTDEATEDERNLVEALSRMLNNSGWFDGYFGEIVAVAVGTLIPDDSDEPERSPDGAARAKARMLNRPMMEALRRCAQDTSPGWDGAVTIYPPGARGLVGVIDALLSDDSDEAPKLAEAAQRERRFVRS